MRWIITVGLMVGWVLTGSLWFMAALGVLTLIVVRSA